MFWKRRQFFKMLAGLVGGSVLPGARAGAAAEAGPPSAASSAAGGVAAKPLPFNPALLDGVIEASHDIVVVGGGISGFCAAVAAARNGANVALVHERSMLGGNSSSEVRLYPENATAHQVWIRECGIFDEIHVEERVRNHFPYREGLMNCQWDLVLYEWVLREPNITLYLNTHMHRVLVNGDGTIEAIYAIQLGSERDYLLRAPLFVDATGDGVLAHRAGAEYRWGREARSVHDEPMAPDSPDEQIMGSSLFFRAVDTGAPVPFKRPEWAAEFAGEEDFQGRNHSFIEGGYWWLEVGPPYHPIKDNNVIIHEGLRHLLGVWDHIKNGGDHGAENYGLEFVATWPYKRECRRIIGDYILTQQHVQDPALLDDNVAFGVWFIDIHTHGILDRSQRPYKSHYEDENWDAKSTRCYGIPLRALYSRNVGNLMMAGRPISCSYVAFSSSRVLCTGAVVGQAVGTAAALCVKHKTSPRDVAARHAKECQQLILRQDGYIPGVVNEDPNDLARQAKVTATSDAPLVFPPSTTKVDLALPKAQIFPVSADRVDRVSLLLRSELSATVEMVIGLRRADHAWDFRGTDDFAEARATVPPDNEGWVHFDLNADVEGGRLYYIHTTAHPGVFWKMFAEDNNVLEHRCPVAVAPGELPGKVHWRPLRNGKSLCMRLDPESRPFTGQNVARGGNRPDRWTNLWQSAPGVPLPQSLELAWDAPVLFNRVELMFDVNMNRRHREALFRYPECVKHYRIEARGDGMWELLHEEKDNYMRRRVHDVPATRADRLRLTVLATNGLPDARVYEVRVYMDGENRRAMTWLDRSGSFDDYHTAS